jgi:hypothetical protein
MTGDVVPLIRRTNELLAVLVRNVLAPVLREELRTPQRKELYRLTGSDLPVKELAKRLGISVGSISGVWRRWEELGLLVKDGQRYRRILDE